MDKLRLFLAVLLPEEIKIRIGSIIKELSSTKADVKWTSTENLHLTMKFLGDTDKSLVDGLVRSLETECERIPAFEAEISNVGSFARHGKPSVIWTGVTHGQSELAYVAGKIDDVTSNFGFEKEKRPFSAHITLGRVRSDKGISKLERAIDAYKEAYFGTIEVNRITLMKSDLRPMGPIYTEIENITLNKQ